MKNLTVTSLALVFTMAALAACKNAGQEERQGTRPEAQAAPVAAKAKPESEVDRGRYLVATSACHDCHTPWAMGPDGPAPDMTRALSGHPESFVMPPAPKLPEGPWIMTASATNTAWSGPWGVSFTANLTPDPETGIGTWTKQTFIDTIRNGRHMGAGRPLLPPMPAPVYANMTDEDLGSIYAYLMTIKPIVNKVPAPIPPAVTRTAAKVPAKG